MQKKSAKKSTQKRERPKYVSVWKVSFDSGYDYLVTESGELPVAALKAQSMFGGVSGLERIAITRFV